MLLPFHIEILPKVPDHKNDAFFMVQHGGASELNPGDGLDTGLVSLNVANVEVWKTHLNVQKGRQGLFHFSETDEWLIGWVNIDEAVNSSLEHLTKEIYQELIKLISQQKFPYLLRVWHYFKQINAVDILERYQAFCVGRHSGLDAYRVGVNDFPAASALGSQNGNFTLYFIAAKTPGVHIENPRQISAYCYPKDYSPKSPAFARATFKEWSHGFQLFISGTASIVMHASHHHNDVQNQTLETLKNIQALIDEAVVRTGIDFSDMDVVWQLKIYLRKATDQFLVANLVSQYFQKAQCLYLQADICRKELLVEIEALASLQKM